MCGDDGMERGEGSEPGQGGKKTPSEVLDRSWSSCMVTEPEIMSRSQGPCDGARGHASDPEVMPLSQRYHVTEPRSMSLSQESSDGARGHVSESGAM